jgi:hypothetical protein
MPALILCYSPKDAAQARALGGYLETNLSYQISYEEGLVGDGVDLVEATERALSAEAALVLLSPHSAPAAWRREEWEPVFFHKPAELGTLLGLVLLSECRFPELFRRHRFFDASQDLMTAARRIRRWLLRPDQPYSGDLRNHALAEAPGIEDLLYDEAMALAAECAADFEAVIDVDCRNRSRAGILGDVGQFAGVRLAGTTQENLATVQQWCAEHRVLFVIRNASSADRRVLALGGKASVAFTTTGESAMLETAAIGAPFFQSPQDETLCARQTGAAVNLIGELLTEDFESALRLAWNVIQFLRPRERYAEMVELLGAMEKEARLRQDALALYRIEWEQSWLRETEPETDSLRILPTASEQMTQLSLF